MDTFIRDSAISASSPASRGPQADPVDPHYPKTDATFTWLRACGVSGLPVRVTTTETRWSQRVIHHADGCDQGADTSTRPRHHVAVVAGTPNWCACILRDVTVDGDRMAFLHALRVIRSAGSWLDKVRYGSNDGLWWLPGLTPAVLRHARVAVPELLGVPDLLGHGAVYDDASLERLRRHVTGRWDQALIDVGYDATSVDAAVTTYAVRALLDSQLWSLLGRLAVPLPLLSRFGVLVGEWAVAGGAAAELVERCAADAEVRRLHAHFASQGFPDGVTDTMCAEVAALRDDLAARSQLVACTVTGLSTDAMARAQSPRQAAIWCGLRARRGDVALGCYPQVVVDWFNSTVDTTRDGIAHHAGGVVRAVGPDPGLDDTGWLTALTLWDEARSADPDSPLADARHAIDVAAAL